MAESLPSGVMAGNTSSQLAAQQLRVEERLRERIQLMLPRRVLISPL